MEQREQRINAIWKRVVWFLADPGIKTYWGEDQDLDYTILRTGPESCKVVWDDGVVAYASADQL